MIKITRFKIKKYRGIAIRIGWLKLERIGYKGYFLWRAEISNWS